MRGGVTANDVMQVPLNIEATEHTLGLRMKGFRMDLFRGLQLDVTRTGSLGNTLICNDAEYMWKDGVHSGERIAFGR